jgi:hypothetical protein
MREGDRSYPGTLRAIFEMARHSCSEYHAEGLLAALTFFMEPGNLLKAWRAPMQARSNRAVTANSMRGAETSYSCTNKTTGPG